jgi:hypothetical protein
MQNTFYVPTSLYVCNAPFIFINHDCCYSYSMPQEALDFLLASRIGVVAVEMTDGSPHAATVHFAYEIDPLTFIILTDRSYRKMEPLLAHGATRASFVVGTDEGEMKTLQLDGVVSLPENESYQETYFARFPEKKEQFEGPDDVFFIFTPTWWRYTDYKAPKEKRITTSQ